MRSSQTPHEMEMECPHVTVVTEKRSWTDLSGLEMADSRAASMVFGCFGDQYWSAAADLSVGNCASDPKGLTYLAISLYLGRSRHYTLHSPQSRRDSGYHLPRTRITQFRLFDLLLSGEKAITALDSIFCWWKSTNVGDKMTKVQSSPLLIVWME